MERSMIHKNIISILAIMFLHLSYQSCYAAYPKAKRKPVAQDFFTHSLVKQAMESGNKKKLHETLGSVLAAFREPITASMATQATLGASSYASSKAPVYAFATADKTADAAMSKTASEARDGTAAEMPEATITIQEAMIYAQSLIPEMPTQEIELSFLEKMEQELIKREKYLKKNNTPGLIKIIVDNELKDIVQTELLKFRKLLEPYGKSGLEQIDEDKQLVPQLVIIKRFLSAEQREELNAVLSLPGKITMLKYLSLMKLIDKFIAAY